MTNWIDALLARVVFHEESDQQYLFLRERGGLRGFPIVIGNPEAVEIQRLLNREVTERPMTHQLLQGALSALGAKLEHVEITALRGHTFHANLALRPAGTDELLRVDARPSDAIALALRANAPIRIAEEVLAVASRPEEPDDEAGDGESA